MPIGLPETHIWRLEALGTAFPISLDRAALIFSIGIL